MLCVDASGKSYSGGNRNNNQKKKQPPPAKIEDVSLDGVVEAVINGDLKVRNTKSAKGKSQAGNTEWLVGAQQGVQVKVHVLGTATVDYLRHGMIVEFSTLLDADDKPTDKINKMSIVESSKDNPLGVFNAADLKPADPGVGGGDDKKPKNAPKKDQKDQDPDKLLIGATGQSKIVGKITSCTADTMVVSAGAKSIKCELGTSPTIDVSLSDPKLIGAGAKVVIHGKGCRGKVNQCWADDVSATLTQPLTGKKKQPHKHDDATAKSDSASESASASDDNAKDADAKADAKDADAKAKDKDADAKADEKVKDKDAKADEKVNEKDADAKDAKPEK
jgi:hypothetical protein